MQVYNGCFELFYGCINKRFDSLIFFHGRGVLQFPWILYNIFRRPNSFTIFEHISFGNFLHLQVVSSFSLIYCIFIQGTFTISKNISVLTM